MGSTRTFETGATRNSDDGKLDFEGFISPLVLQRYAEYMHKHRRQEDGSLRDSDNWQRGIPQAAYMKSGWRHFVDWWSEHRGYGSRDGIEEALCALIFNAMGYLHEILKAHPPKQKRPPASGLSPHNLSVVNCRVDLAANVLGWVIRYKRTR